MMDITVTDGGASKGRRVQRAAIDAEFAIDQALAGGGELIARIVTASWAAGLPPARVQRALRLTMQSMDAGMTMRANSHRAHRELAGIMGELDLQELGWGDLAGSPSAIRELHQETAAPRHLRVVA